MNKIIVGFLTFILSFILLFGFFGFLSKSTNNFTENFDDFYILYNGEKVSSSDNILIFELDSEHRFDCKYFSNIVSEKSKTFKYTIMPYVINGNDLSFKVNSDVKQYYEVGELTECFEISVDDGGFTIKIPKDFSLEGILGLKYPNKTLTFGQYRKDIPLYCLTITNNDDSQKYDFKFYVNF